MLKHLLRGAFGLLAVTVLALPAASSSAAASPGIQATVLYKIEQTTGNVSDAGTDSTVKYQLCGVTLCTAIRTLDDPNKDDRERGNTDIYTREWEDVGRVVNLYILQGTDGSGWYLETVRLIYSGLVDSYPYDGWMPRGTWVRIPVG